MPRHARYFCICSTLVAACAALPNDARAALILSVPANVNLQPNQNHQAIQVSASGGNSVAGINLNIRLGDGRGAGVEPAFYFTGQDQFAGFDFTTGTIWGANGQRGTAIEDSASEYQIGFLLNGTNSTVPANGVVATVYVDTTGFTTGTYPLLLNILNGSGQPVDSSFIAAGGSNLSADSVVVGQITIVPEPAASALGLLGVLGLLGGRRRRVG
jgi:MYXO-CTERM domain-containing protein